VPFGTDNISEFNINSKYQAYKSIVVTLCRLAELSESIFNFLWGAFCAVVEGVNESAQELDTHCNMQAKHNILYHQSSIYEQLPNTKFNLPSSCKNGTMPISTLLLPSKEMEATKHKL